MKAKQPTVSVIVLTRNRSGLLRQCLESLLAQQLSQRYEVVVVDDGSTDDTKDVVGSFRERAPEVQVRYFHHRHRGMVASRLRGIEESDGDLIVFLDDDAIPAQNWLREFVAEASLPGVGIVGGRVQSAPQKCLIASIGDAGQLRWSGFDAETSSADVDFVPGGNMAVWRAALEKAGSFDSNYAGTAWREETDLCVRLKRAGYGIRYTSGANVRHYSERWDRWSLLRPRIQFSMAKNNGYFAGKNFGGRRTILYWLLIEPANWGSQQFLRSSALIVVLPVRWLGAAWGLTMGMRARGAGGTEST